MSIFVRTQAATGASTMCPLNTRANPFSVGLTLVYSGTATAKVQFTHDDPVTASDTLGTGLVWLDHPTLSGGSTNDSGNLAFGARAVRLNVTAWTSGTVKMTVIQAGL